MQVNYPDMQLRIVPVTPFRQNCSVLWHEKTRKAVIVDAGGDADVLLDFLKKNILEVEAILLTHGHLDHAGGVAALCRGLENTQKTRPDVVGPNIHDQFLLQSIVEQARHFGLSDLENADVDRFTEDGESLNYLGCTFRVVHVPGHTPGHVVFVDKKARFAFVGDVLFRGTIGRTDFAYGNSQQLIQGIKEKLLPLGDDIVIVPGHGGLTTLGAERASNPFLQR
ncbi:MBL fold metallo-hydrolase [Acetobacter pasteurianus]|uniref:Metallo-beta-lactamase n=1 Tax=Acetobacter pasteurianus NBRC 3188 TaxID=1226663 RepID=A0A401WWA7_ACEPA|nr:MBL fold metallo-hydrolase [Acetobacter pasteurianus]GCD53606.1 metallo-beta-lactamase [Acetobacter pasteurianus NBRC 3188]